MLYTIVFDAVVVVDLCSKYIFEYAKVAEELDKMVGRMIFESYGLSEYYESYMRSTGYLLRLLAHTAPEEVEPQLGLVAHTDKSFTTILHQNHVNALMVETRNGVWIHVDFSATNSFVVLAGDGLMVRTNLHFFKAYFYIYLFLILKFEKFIIINAGLEQ